MASNMLIVEDNFVAIEGIEFAFYKSGSSDICCTVSEPFKEDETFNLGKVLPVEVKAFIKKELAYRL